jgi:hypothetical protein
MKYKLLFFFLLFGVKAATAQANVQVNFTDTAGELYITSGNVLALSAAFVTSATRNGNDLFEGGLVGSLNFTTPAFQHGSTANGGSFGIGGNFGLFTVGGASLNAHFLGGEWRKMEVAPGVNGFVLTATITGTLLLENGVSVPVRGHTVQLSPSAPGAFIGFVFGSGGATSVTAD